jgi:hypothetical protein
MSKQTSVDFLIEEFSAILGNVNFTAMQGLLLKDAVERAKEMEKEQIIEAHLHGMDFIPVDPNYKGDAENYYNETYKKIDK